VKKTRPEQIEPIFAPRLIPGPGTAGGPCPRANVILMRLAMAIGARVNGEEPAVVQARDEAAVEATKAEPCDHPSCRSRRAIAENSSCPGCGEPIGYDAPYLMVDGAAVHEDCLIETHAAQRGAA
jgi:hypothetical protein